MEQCWKNTDRGKKTRNICSSTTCSTINPTLGWPAIKTGSLRSESSEEPCGDTVESSVFNTLKMEAVVSLKLWYLYIQPNCDASRKSVFLIFTNIEASNVRRKEVRFNLDRVENLFYFDYYFDLERTNERNW
jgi:hypothetical protein